MVGVFLRLRQRPKVEVINNSSGDVATLFRVLQRHYPYMIDILRFRIASRAEFERLKAQRPETLTDLERATRFLYLQKLAFGGKVAERGFGVDKSQGVRFNICRLGPELRSRRHGVASRPGVLGCGSDYDRTGSVVPTSNCSTTSGSTSRRSLSCRLTKSPGRVVNRTSATFDSLSFIRHF